ncbi:Mobile element protein [Geobacillus proteiniphilus]|uniref:Mobile element protein n=1 Tax=Geobacillus proteiniphilus TaxID=860353 RepID=A0A1Q5T957_9BACL|nr:Mobile element protein [Geobacillus proteiniphilus]
MLGHFSSQNDDLYQRTELTAKQALFLGALGLEPPPKILGIRPRA